MLGAARPCGRRSVVPCLSVRAAHDARPRAARPRGDLRPSGGPSHPTGRGVRPVLVELSSRARPGAGASVSEGRDRSAVLALGIVLALTALAYLPALRGELVYDDLRFVRDNPAIRSLANVPRFFSDPTTMSASEDRDIYRPLRTLVFALEYQVAGDHPTLYHVVNLAWHLASAVALFLLLRAGGWFSPLFTVLAVGLFALHPGISEAVAWISSC